MAVAFDAVGSATGFATATPSTTPWLTWTHTAGTGGGTIIVGLAWGSNTFPPTITSITYGGNAMTALGSIATNNTSGNGGVLLYGITGQASGANTVLVKTSANPTNVLIGNSISFTGATGFGTAQTYSGSASPVTGSLAGTASGNMVAVVEAHGTNNTNTWTAGTGRFDDEVGAATGASNLSGATLAAGGSVTFSETLGTSDVWGAVAVEVQGPATVTPQPPQPGGAAYQRRYRRKQQPWYSPQQPGPAGNQPGGVVYRRRPARAVQGGVLGPQPPVATGPAGQRPGGVVVYRRPARAVWGGVAAQPGQPLINGTVQPRPVIARRTPARGSWQGTRTATVNAVPGVPAGQQPHGFTSSRRPVGGLWGGAYSPRPNASGPAGTVQPRPAVPVPRRATARAVWRAVAGAALTPGPAGSVQPRATVPVPRRRPARALWAGQSTPQPHVPGQVQPRATVPVPRRTTARAVWAGQSTPQPHLPGQAQPWPTVPVPRRRTARVLWQSVLGVLNAHGPSGAVQPKATVPVPRRVAARVLWRSEAGPANAHGPSGTVQPKPVVARRVPARAVWAGTVVRTSNGSASPPVNGTVPPHLVIGRRAAARAAWSGTTVRTANAVPPVTVTGGRVTRRVPARAVIRGNPAPFPPPSGTLQPAPTAPARRRVPQRVIWRGNPVPGQQPLPATGGLVRRRGPARGQWHSAAGSPPPAPGGTPATGGRVVTRRPPSRGQWSGTTVRTSNALPPAVPAPRQRLTVPRRTAARAWWAGTASVRVNASQMILFTPGHARQLWTAGHARQLWTAGKARQVWGSGRARN